jgi:putative CocE/NonD family hydrolase
MELFLRCRGLANTRNGDGRLAATAGGNACDTYSFDPRNPVPTVGGSTLMTGMEDGSDCGPLDQRAVEDRPDVLCYTGAALRRPLTVVGEVRLTLYVSSSAVDTDFTAKLVDVFPNGRAEILCDGIVRTGRRDPDAGSAPLLPGTVYELHISVGAVAHQFRTGHRIRIDVSSSNFPRFDPNPNTGGLPRTLASGPMVVAVNRIHHGEAYPSRLVVPVIDLGQAHETS